MKKEIIILILFIFFFTLSPPCLATKEEILKSQSETLNINEFVQQANKYTKEVFDGIDTKDLLNEAIQGKIDNKTIFNKVINLFGKEVKDTIKIIRKYYCNCYNTQYFKID